MRTVEHLLSILSVINHMCQWCYCHGTNKFYCSIFLMMLIIFSLSVCENTSPTVSSKQFEHQNLCL